MRDMYSRAEERWRSIIRMRGGDIEPHPGPEQRRQRRGHPQAETQREAGTMDRGRICTERWRKIIRMRGGDIKPHSGPLLSKLGGDEVRKRPVRKDERKIAWRDEKQVKAWLQSKSLRIASQLCNREKPQSRDSHAAEQGLGRRSQARQYRK